MLVCLSGTCTFELPSEVDGWSYGSLISSKVLLLVPIVLNKIISNTFFYIYYSVKLGK